MKAIPIDAFLERAEAARGRGGASSLPLPLAADWSRLVAEGRAARAEADGGRWRVGQLANLVERRYRSGALQRFAAEIGESYATVRRLRWVVGRYEPGVRHRFETLSFSHFQAVAGLPDRAAWLGRAARGGWSVDRLTRESRAGTERPARRAKPEHYRARLSAATRGLGEIAALDDRAVRRAGREWLTEAVDDLAREVQQLQARLHRLNRPARGRNVVRLRTRR